MAPQPGGATLVFQPGVPEVGNADDVLHHQTFYTGARSTGVTSAVMELVRAVDRIAMDAVPAGSPSLAEWRMIDIEPSPRGAGRRFESVIDGAECVHLSDGLTQVVNVRVPSPTKGESYHASIRLESLGGSPGSLAPAVKEVTLTTFGSSSIPTQVAKFPSPETPTIGGLFQGGGREIMAAIHERLSKPVASSSPAEAVS